MKKTVLTLLGIIGLSFFLSAQKYFTKNAFVEFYSHASVEDIIADNNQVSAAIDSKTGDIVFKVLMKSFQFKKALMQEHFNENYIESDKYPNSTFIGKITDLKNVDFSKDGKCDVHVDGDLIIHGITKHISENGTLEINGSRVSIRSTFSILLADFHISIPNTLINNISKSIEIRINATLEKMTK